MGSPGTVLSASERTGGPGMIDQHDEVSQRSPLELRQEVEPMKIKHDTLFSRSLVSCLPVACCNGDRDASLAWPVPAPLHAPRHTSDIRH